MADKEPQKEKSIGSLVSLVWDLGFIFALPLVIFAIVGRILDNRLETSPLFLLAGIIGAAVASSVGVFFKVRTLMGAIDSDQPKDKTEKTDNTLEPPSV